MKGNVEIIKKLQNYHGKVISGGLGLGKGQRNENEISVLKLTSDNR